VALNFPLEGSGSDEKYAGVISFTAINTSTGSSRAAAAASASSGGLGDLGRFGRGDQSGTVQSYGGAVNLYLPQGITISDGVGYENTDLGIIGAGVAYGAEALSNKGASAGISQILSDATSTIDRFKSNFSGTELAKYAPALAEMFPGVGSAVAAGTGITANPHRRSIFKDVALRQFSFNFTMQPTSADEANVIKEIVKFFRVNLYPEKLGQIAYKFPTKFEIKFTYGGKEVANKLLPCYMTSVQTQYNPRSSSFHTGGEFTETGISLTFQEETTLDKQKIAEGGY